MNGRSYLGAGFALRCFQRLSFPCLAAQLYHWHDNWSTSGRSIPVLSYMNGRSYLGAGFALRCFQRLSFPCLAAQLYHWHDNWSTSGRSIPVLSYWRTAPLRSPSPTTDRDRTVSRRSEPSSRTALMGGQPNPWNRIQLQDAISRHRGAKPRRRRELLVEISL